MKRRYSILLWAGFLVGVLYWILESVLHTYVFNNGSLRTTLLCEHDPNEMWMRIIILGLFSAFGGVTERLVRSERRNKDRANKLSGLFSYVLQISQLMGNGPEKEISESSRQDVLTIEASLLDEGEIGKIVHAIQGLSRHIDTRIEGLNAVLDLTHEINKGLLEDEVLERIYETFRSVIPYDRIGVALLEDEGRVLACRWARLDYGETRMTLGYSAPIANSSLQRIIETGEPRIINDLAAYLAEHPSSSSSSLLVDEGIRSSLTCPLIAVGKPIGFIFFSSREPGTYENAHSEFFKLIAGQLSVVIEKSHIYERLVREKEVSESLLLNVMPARIIARMKGGSRNPVEEIPEAGVLFVDIVGFTEVSRRFSAERIVQFLLEVFTQLDVLCEKHHIEKIKTIGDAYMVSTGLASPGIQYLLNLATFAQDVVAATSATHYPDGRPLSVRIGLHAGAVTAGVIGQKKFAYDIWGDTVNIAQRLESTGVPGHVHVTERVYSLLKDEDFTFEPRGEMELKGAGRMPTYFMKRKSVK